MILPRSVKQGSEMVWRVDAHEAGTSIDIRLSFSVHAELPFGVVFVVYDGRHKHQRCQDSYRSQHAHLPMRRMPPTFPWRVLSLLPGIMRPRLKAAFSF